MTVALAAVKRGYKKTGDHEDTELDPRLLTSEGGVDDWYDKYPLFCVQI